MKGLPDFSNYIPVLYFRNYSSKLMEDTRRPFSFGRIRFLTWTLGFLFLTI